MKEIQLTNGQRTLVDARDYKWLRKFTWSNCNGYATTTLKYSGGREPITMHRLLMGCTISKKLCIDHINRNRLDNQRSNLRIITRSQNFLNSDHHEKTWNKGKTSRFRGVSWKANRQLWQVFCKQKHVGLFQDELLAASAYNEAAIKTFGTFANLNTLE